MKMKMMNSFLDQIFDILEFSPTQKDKAKADIDNIIKTAVLRNLEATLLVKKSYGEFSRLSQQERLKKLSEIVRSRYTNDQIKKVELRIAERVLTAYLMRMVSESSAAERGKLSELLRDSSKA